GPGARWPDRLDGGGGGGFGYLAGMPPGRTNSLQEEIRAGRGHVSPAPLLVLQENADRARMRRQTQRSGLHGVLGQADRGLAEKLDLIRSGDAVGNRRPSGEVCRLDRALILEDEAYAAQNTFAAATRSKPSWTNPARRRAARAIPPRWAIAALTSAADELALRRECPTCDEASMPCPS